MAKDEGLLCRKYRENVLIAMPVCIYLKNWWKGVSSHRFDNIP
jgi:hypothetical protein